MKNFKEFLNEKNTGKKIMSDVDGVIVDFGGAFKQWMQTNFPKVPVDITITGPTAWTFGLEKDEAWKFVELFWNTPAGVERLPFFPGAKAGFNRLAKNFSIHVVTALDPRFKGARLKNLSGFNYDSITIKGQGKLEHILNVTKPDIAIEDKPEYIKKMSAAGIDVYYPVLPLTSGVGAGTKYRSWKQLVKMIEDKYLK